MINFLFLAGTQFFLFRAITGNYPSNNAWTNHSLSVFKTNIFFTFGVSFFLYFSSKNILEKESELRMHSRMFKAQLKVL